MTSPHVFFYVIYSSYLVAFYLLSFTIFIDKHSFIFLLYLSSLFFLQFFPSPLSCGIAWHKYVPFLKVNFG